MKYFLTNKENPKHIHKYDMYSQDSSETGEKHYSLNTMFNYYYFFSLSCTLNISTLLFFLNNTVVAIS